MASRWKPSTKNWGQKAYEEVMAKYPEIKTGSVALCVWAYARDPNTPIETLRELAEADKEIANVAGRAQGSARQILGLAPKVSKKAKKRGRKPKDSAKARAKPAVRKRATGGKPSTHGIEDFLAVVRSTEKERDELRSTLERVKNMIESAL